MTGDLLSLALGGVVTHSGGLWRWAKLTSTLKRDDGNLVAADRKRLFQAKQQHSHLQRIRWATRMAVALHDAYALGSCPTNIKLVVQTGKGSDRVSATISCVAFFQKEQVIVIMTAKERFS